MSAQDHAHHDHGADEHDAAAHDDHAHDEPPPPEPESPGWLPLLGGGLFLLGLIGYLVLRTPEPGEEGSAPGAAAAASAPAKVAPAAGSAAAAPRRMFPTLKPDRLRDAVQANGAVPPKPPAH